jgi:predicted ATP-grasp superfamily ATP-dependent carboligase
MIALALTRSLGRRGMSVIRVHPNRLDRSLSSRYCSKIEICPDFYEAEHDLVEFLLTISHRYDGARVLIPASDDCAYFVATHYQTLQQAYAIVGPSWPTMAKVLDKMSQYEQAAAIDLPIPETYRPASVGEVENLAARLQNYPYVIKPIVAHQWRLASMQAVSKGKKGFAVNTAQELIARYKEIAQLDNNVMVQEVIGGRDELLFTFLSYFDEQSRPLAYCVRKKIRQMPVDFGYCTMTVTCSDPVVVEQSIRLLKSIGYSGISGVEWKLDPRTGKYKLIEINARAVNTIGIAAACGVDIPYIAVLDKLGLKPDPVTSWRQDVKWINIVQDIWAASELSQMKRLTFRQWRASIAGKKVDAVFSLADPWPFAGYFAAFIRTVVRGRLRRHRYQSGH